MRTYSSKAKLLITLSFLAHCSTLRQMASKWGCPHNSIADLCLHTTTLALRLVFLGDPPTRNIRFPWYLPACTALNLQEPPRLCSFLSHQMSSACTFPILAEAGAARQHGSTAYQSDTN
jgi:hypothetical protein